MSALGQTSMHGKSAIRELLIPYAVLAANRPLQILVVCHTASRIVQWLYLVALFVLGYDLTHSASTVALLTFLRFLPNALLLPVSGALTDRWNRKLLMVISNGGRAVCVLGLLAVHSQGTLPFAYVLLFAATVLSSLFRPALVAILPEIVEERELVQANAIVTQIEMVSLGVGPAIGGILILIGSTDAAFVLAGVVFVLCALAIAATPLPNRRPTELIADAGWAEHLAGGYRFIASEFRGVLLGYVFALAAMQLLSGASWTIAVVLSERVFGFGGEGVGFLNGAYGAGGFIGGLLLGPVIARRSFPGVFAVAGVVSCTSSALYGFSPLGVVAFLFNMGAGLADVFTKVSAMSIIQIATPNALIGRVFGAFESTLILAQLAGAILVVPAISFFGPRGANFAFCVAGLAGVLLCLPLVVRTTETLGSRIFLRQVPALNPVSFYLLDDLAARVRLEHYDPGRVIVRQGDPGDAFYLVRSGEVLVRARGDEGHDVHIATLHAMDYFGELALLNDAPRNATVVAAEPVEVYRLDRSDFQELLQRADRLRPAMNGAGAEREAELRTQLLTRM